MENQENYNPLEKKHLGESVVRALLEQEPTPLSQLSSFKGAGIYAIYYLGDFPTYLPLAKANRGKRFSAPIYVGKATPSGGRKGFATGVGHELLNRLRDHKKSIEQASNLDIKDFYCRYLIVDEAWISLAESILIGRFKPLWNGLLDGFGNHDPGGGRRAGKNSKWDVLHPGRKWAGKSQQRQETTEDLVKLIEEYLLKR